jgi:hypothetical protein
LPRRRPADDRSLCRRRGEIDPRALFLKNG